MGCKQGKFRSIVNNLVCSYGQQMEETARNSEETKMPTKQYHTLEKGATLVPGPSNWATKGPS
jgi:hypothetical protein